MRLVDKSSSYVRLSGVRFPAMTAFNVSVLRLLTNCYPVSRPPKIDSRFAENRTDDTTADFVLRVLYDTYLTLLVITFNHGGLCVQIL